MPADHSSLQPANPRRADLLAVVVFAVPAAALAWGWFTIGPDQPIYGLMVAAGTFAAGPALGGPVERRVPEGWFRVPGGEQTLHRALGVTAFGRVLQRSGWNRAIADPMRDFDGTRAGLPALDRSLRGNVCAHGVCFLVHVSLAVLTVATGHLSGALWILLPGIMIHFYPVMLQRSIALRLQRLRDRLPPGRHQHSSREITGARPAVGLRAAGVREGAPLPRPGAAPRASSTPMTAPPKRFRCARSTARRYWWEPATPLGTPGRGW